MEFTYGAYTNLINLLKENNYVFTDYVNYNKVKKAVIFRHDVDNSLGKALEIARLENKNRIKSTYFLLLSTNFYNIFSKESSKMLNEVMNLEHEIGLHFDEKRYEIGDEKELEGYIEYEKNILEKALDKKIKVVSMHRPSKWILENDIQFGNIINSYSKVFIKKFKYLSDSRMYWREDVLNIVKSNKHDRLHILTHPFWYSNKKQQINEKIMEFVNDGRIQRYNDLLLNIEDLNSLIDKGKCH